MTLILTAITFVMILAGFTLPHEQAGTKIAIRISGFILLIITLCWGSYYSVPAGHRGVLLQFGAVKGTMSEGANFVIPYAQSVEVMEVRTQKESAKASAASRDLQTVSASVAVNYHIDPATVGVLYKNVGKEFSTRIIDPAVQETVKAVVAQYTAEELVSKRQDVKAQIDNLLSDRLSRYNIIVEPGGVSLTNFDFSDEFNRAIERKQVAQQTAEQQKYELQKAKLEAETAIATAEGRAKAARIEAEALNSQGGNRVLMKQFLEKWDGKLPTVSGSGQSMIFDMKSLMDPPSKK